MPAFFFHTRALKVDLDKGRLKELLDKFGERFGRPKIRCPLCAWQPRREDLWACSCLFQWHTFDTGGVCPACDYQWQDTKCFQCHQWSKHVDWYADEDDDGSEGGA